MFKIYNGFKLYNLIFKKINIKTGNDIKTKYLTISFIELTFFKEYSPIISVSKKGNSINGQIILHKNIDKINTINNKISLFLKVTILFKFNI